MAPSAAASLLATSIRLAQRKVRVLPGAPGLLTRGTEMLQELLPGCLSFSFLWLLLKSFNAHTVVVCVLWASGMFAEAISVFCECNLQVKASSSTLSERGTFLPDSGMKSTSSLYHCLVTHTEPSPVPSFPRLIIDRLTWLSVSDVTSVVQWQQLKVAGVMSQCSVRDTESVVSLGLLMLRTTWLATAWSTWRKKNN